MDSGSSTHAALTGCVSSLRSSMHLLESSINILDAGVSDYPRLATVIQTTKHFELLSESDLTAAQTSLLAEIHPEINTLLARVEAYLDKLERREKSLMAKADLQAGRLQNLSSQQHRSAAGALPGRGKRSVTGGTGGAGTGTGLEELKLQQLRQKKERLSYAVGRLELQAGQKKRQLRMSMAAQA